MPRGAGQAGGHMDDEHPLSFMEILLQRDPVTQFAVEIAFRAPWIVERRGS